MSEAASSIQPDEIIARQKLLDEFAKLPEKQQSDILEKITLGNPKGNSAEIAKQLEELLETAAKSEATIRVEVEQAAARGLSVGQIGLQVGAGDAVVTNIAQNVALQNQQVEQRVELANAKAMHDETVAKVEGVTPTHPFAGMVDPATLAAFATIAALNPQIHSQSHGEDVGRQLASQGTKRSADTTLQA